MVFPPPASYGLKSPTVEYLANSSYCGFDSPIGNSYPSFAGASESRGTKKLAGTGAGGTLGF
jgi:hypothetical protein